MSADIHERLAGHIEERRDDAVALLQELVRIPSVVGTAQGEAQAQQRVVEELTRAGMATDVWEPRLEELRQYRAFVPVQRDYSGRPVVVGVRQGRGGGRSLAFNVHIDVVPVDPNTTWQHDPFGGELEGGRVYGRGAADMKGGVVAGLLALQALAALDVPLRGDLLLESVSDEEDGGNTTLACIHRGYRPDATVFLEPTSPDYVYVSSRGAQFFRLRVPGVEGGVEYRHQLPNAIDKALLLYRAVEAYWQMREAEARHPLYQKGPRTGTKIPVAICRIQAGAWPSTVPGECLMEGTLECLPGEDIEQEKERFWRYVMKAAAQDPWLRDHPPELEWFGLYLEPAAIDPKDPLVTALTAAAERVCGRRPEVAGGGGNDLRLPVLYAHRPAVLFGPRGGLIHSVDEYVEVDSVIEVAKTVASLAVDWCS